MLDPTLSEVQALREMAWHLRVRRDHLLQVLQRKRQPLSIQLPGLATTVLFASRTPTR